MAVRSFDGIDDEITCSIGALAAVDGGDCTLVAIVKSITGGEGRHVLSLRDSGGTPKVTQALTFLDRLAYSTNGNFVTTETVTSPVSDGWVLIAAGKAPGISTVRFHEYVFSTGTWSHEESIGTLADSIATMTSVQFGNGFGEPFNGLIAVLGVFPTKFTDAAIEAAGLEVSLQNWLDSAADACWPLNQTTATTPVKDITGNGADETAITGTAVVTSDDPDGFSFGLLTSLRGRLSGRESSSRFSGREPDNTISGRSLVTRAGGV